MSLQKLLVNGVLGSFLLLFVSLFAALVFSSISENGASPIQKFSEVRTVEGVVKSTSPAERGLFVIFEDGRSVCFKGFSQQVIIGKKNKIYYTHYFRNKPGYETGEIVQVALI